MTNDSITPRMRLNPKQERSFAVYILVAVVLMVVLMSEGRAEIATTQSKHPWTINDCDKKLGRADAVFNLSLWNPGGWPLWRVICWKRT